MELGNIHKPTSAKWTKIQMACTNASMTIAGYGHFSDNHWVFGVGCGLAVVASVIPALMSDGVDTNNGKTN